MVAVCGCGWTDSVSETHPDPIGALHADSPPDPSGSRWPHRAGARPSSGRYRNHAYVSQVPSVIDVTGAVLVRTPVMRAMIFLAIVGCAAADGDPKPEQPRTSTGGSEGPLVLELFTSQGCSSCPPAEQVLASLGRDGTGRPLAPLAFHVDYWNGLGWADPFSMPAWTERQHGYADAFGDRSVYTPELVIGGSVGLVGSSRDQIKKAITAAPRIELLAATATWRPDAVDVTATAPMGADVFVAVWEATTTTRVPRGENAGETLVSDRVVRRFERVARAGQTETTTVKLDSRWQTVGAVAFAQRTDRKIVASAML
ncbi:MAG: DUF1223 domain-containing protein [Proteobacteria bacterium]|nr:DUF1223 domain-containing protein [Pseudomonadota bacterium]